MNKGDLKMNNPLIGVDKYEKVIIELSRWKPGIELSQTTSELIGEINNENDRDNLILNIFQKMKESTIDDRDKDKLYLSEIIKSEKAEFGKNNLILSPTGSGKTSFINNYIKENKVINSLLIVSTTSLKDKLAPSCNKIRKRISNRMYTTKNENIYGEGSHKILVMTYSEFGNKMLYKDSFGDKYSHIFCDEIHSLINFYNMNKDTKLFIAMRYLFLNKSESKQQKFHFTATNEYIDKMKIQNPELFKDLKVFDYLKHPNIRRHLVLSSYKIRHIEQTRIHIKARKESFKYFNYKGFAFCKTIDSQLKLAKIIEESGLKPLVLWSPHNIDKPMNNNQMKYRDYVLETGMIPDEFDFLIINSAMQEGWDLKDPRVKLVIMNTVNETEFVQALGRLRRDVDVLVYKTTDNNSDYYIDFPLNLINVPLNTKDKEKLTQMLDLRNEKGKLLGWSKMKETLNNQGYVIEEARKRINGTVTRVSIVRHPK